MTDQTIHTVGGVNLDKDPRAFKPNELSHALDNELFGVDEGQDLSYRPLKSSKLAYTIPPLTQQFQCSRMRFDPSVTSYTFILKDSVGDYITGHPITILVTGTLSDFITDFEAALSPSGYHIVKNDDSGLWVNISIYYGSNNPVEYSMRQYETDGSSTTEILVYTLQDSYNPIGAVAGQLEPLSNIQLLNYSFTLSKTYDGLMTTFGYAIQDDNGDWTYTQLFASNKIRLPNDKVVEMQCEEVNNNKYAFYWADGTGKPKVVYVPTQLGLNAVLKYTTTHYTTPLDGLFTLESIDEQTNLQIQNPSVIAFESQIESGGSLSSGTWYYYSAVGINNDYSEWSSPSQPVTVFKDSTTSPSAGSTISGDKTPTTTSKINKLLVTGYDPKIYNKIKIAAMLNQNGAYTAIQVGEFNISQYDFEVQHSGNENGVIDIDVNTLPPVQDVIENTVNIQTKKNRMNIADVTIAIDEDLTPVFENVVLGQVREELDSVGAVDYSSSQVVSIGAPNPYTTSVVQGTEKGLNFTTIAAPFYNDGSYDIHSWIWTVPSTGQYTLTYNLFCNTTQSTDVNIDTYFVDIVTGEKYCLLENQKIATGVGSFFATQLASTQNVSLIAGQQIALKYYNTQAVATTGINWYAKSSFTTTKIISNYPTKSIRVGEFQLPTNIANFTGYMINETYPFFARVKYNNGYLSSWYPLGEYTFSNGNSEATLPDAYLTDSTASASTYKTYTYGLTVDGIDVSTIKDKISGIEIGRGICNPSILGTGMFIASDTNTGGGYTSGVFTGNTDGVTGVTYGDSHLPANDNRYFGNLICPDWMTGAIKPTYQSGDYLLVYGCNQTLPLCYTNIIGGGGGRYGAYREFFGAFLPFTGSPTKIDIEDGQWCDFNTNSRILKNNTANKFLFSQADTTGAFPALAAQNMALTLSSRIKNIGSFNRFNDWGCYYVQYVRPITNQYDTVNTRVMPCGKFIPISTISDDILPQEMVFGGDTYTQKTYTKIMYNAKNPDTAKNGFLTSFIGFYSQNKINQQMRYVDSSFTNRPFPFGTSLDEYLFGTYDGGEQFQIDKGYTWESPINLGTVYNPEKPQQRFFHSRIYYSQSKVVNALQDAYRTILPNDYKDMPIKDGNIYGILDVNDYLIVIQPKAVSSILYQADVAISGTQIYIGSGGVFAQRENKISTYGTSIKSSILIAENEGGNTQVYWISNTAKMFMRYGGDGVKSLSNINGWRTFFNNNLSFANSEFDIVMGYDRTRGLIFATSRAVNKAIPIWVSGASYSAGDYVRYQGAGVAYHNFELLPEVYVAKNNNNGSLPYNNPDDWEFIPITDNRYYNYYTCMYNEKANFFQGFFSLLASRYFNYNGKMFLPRGRADYGEVYDLFGGDSGEYLQWLSNGSTYKQGSFELEWVSTKQGLTPERYRFITMQVGTDHINNPDIEVSTESQLSATTSSDMTLRTGILGAPIYPDGSNDPIIGEYAKIKLTSATYYRIYGLVVHFYSKMRGIFK